MRLALRRSAPAIVASSATVILALLALLLADMNSTRGLGPVAARRHRLGAAGDDHTAAGTAGDLRALGVLAGDPEAAAAARRGAEGLGRRRRRGRPPPARRLGRHRRGAGRADAPASRRMSTGLHARRLVHHQAGLRPRRWRCSPAHFPAGVGRARPRSTPAPTAATRSPPPCAGVAGVADVRAAEPSTDGAWVRVPVVLADDPDSRPGQAHGVRHPRGRARRGPGGARRRRHRAGSRPGDDDEPRPAPGAAGDPAGGAARPDRAAAGRRGAAAAARQRGAVLRRGAWRVAR